MYLLDSTPSPHQSSSLGEIGVGPERSAAFSRTGIFALGNNTICQVINKSHVGIGIIIRDLPYAAVGTIGIYDAFAVIAIILFFRDSIKRIVRKCYIVSVPVHLL